MKKFRPVLLKDPQGNSIQGYYSDVSERVEYNTSGNPIYIGKSKPGTKENEIGWQICSFEYDGTGNVTARKWAESSNDFSFKWSDRSTYSY